MTAVDRAFTVSLLLKGASGALETLGGLLLLLVRPEALSDAATFLTARELGQDPHDFLATSILGVTSDLTGSATLFAALYLLGHGVLKLFLVWAVLGNRLWAFPLMMAFLVGFIGFQSYELTRAFSWGLLALTVFDVFVLWLTAVEYRKRLRVRRNLRAPDGDAPPDGHNPAGNRGLSGRQGVRRRRWRRVRRREPRHHGRAVDPR